MLHNAVRAFVDRNADLARATMAIEPRVNQVRDSLSAELVEWRQQGRLPLEALPPLIDVARRFERVSDQATNICEEALYFATGEYLRHLPREGFRVLFVDETNGCLSRMAEAIGNGLGAKRFSFSSAGMTGRRRRSADDPVPGGEGYGHLPPAVQVRGRGSAARPGAGDRRLCKGAERALPQRPARRPSAWTGSCPIRRRRAGTPDGSPGGLRDDIRSADHSHPGPGSGDSRKGRASDQ